MKKLILTVLFLVPGICYAMQEDVLWVPEQHGYSQSIEVASLDQSNAFWQDVYSHGYICGTINTRRAGEMEAYQLGKKAGEEGGQQTLEVYEAHLQCQTERNKLRRYAQQKLAANLEGKWKNPEIRKSILENMILITNLLECNAKRHEEIEMTEEISEKEHEFMKQQEQEELAEWGTFFGEEKLKRIKAFVWYKKNQNSEYSQLQLHYGMLLYHLGQQEEGLGYARRAHINPGLDKADRQKYSWMLKEGE